MRYDPRNRLGRIRVRWVTALAGLALVPLLVVIATMPYQIVVQSRLGAAATAAVRDARQTDDLEAVATKHHVRLVVYVDGQPVERHGRAVMSRWTNHVAMRFVDGTVADSLTDYDRAHGLSVAQAGSECALAVDDNLLTCRAWGADRRGRTVVAEAAAVRTISTLWGHRAPLFALALQMLLLALAVGIWAGRRTVHPIHRLRREVASRTARPVSTEPIPVDGSDEVAELGHSFNELLAALQSQREANMDFLAEVAHELKTPIATIQQFADLARGLDDPRLEQPLAALESSCSRLHLRTGELMELARASAGLPGLERELVHLGTFVENLTAIHHSNIEVSTCSAAVSVSPRYLEIALRNVLDNAVHHARGRVWVEMRLENDQVVVLVRDDGEGIADEELELVFERFHTHRVGGTGLGLAMTRAVMRAHGGEAQARQGTGATIELVLPIA